MSAYTIKSVVFFPLTNSVSQPGGDSNICMFIPNPREMIQFDEHIFQMGWFNHKPPKKYRPKHQTTGSGSKNSELPNIIETDL